MEELEKWKIYFIASGVYYSGYFQRSEPWHGTRTTEVLNQAIQKRMIPFLPLNYLTITNAIRVYNKRETDEIGELCLDVTKIIFAYDVVKNLGRVQKKILDQHIVKGELPVVRVVSKSDSGIYFVFDGELIWNAAQMDKNAFWPLKVNRFYQFSEKTSPTAQNINKLKDLTAEEIRTFVINSRFVENIEKLAV